MASESTTASTARETPRAAKVYSKAAICLVVGLVVGYLCRGSQSPASPSLVSIKAAPSGLAGGGLVPSAGDPRPTAARQRGAMAGGRMPSLEEMKQMADKQAAPLLEKLKSDPNDSALLTQVGAIYHTSHQFKEAAYYYEKAVQVDPQNVALRTRLASSLYRYGDVDGAIAQLHRALKYDPKDANALFDLGMIKLQGKQDGKGALAAWQQLLKSNPQLSPDRKATVQKLMADVLTTMGDQQAMEGARTNDGHN